jgi:hypothetical protein
MNITAKAEDLIRHRHAMRKTLNDVWGAPQSQSMLGFEDLQSCQRLAGRINYYANRYLAWVKTLPSNCMAEPFHPCDFIDADGVFDLPGWLAVPEAVASEWELTHGKPVA